MPENEVPVVQKFDLEELIYNFHQCGIHVVVQTSNVGLMLTITDRLSRIRGEQLIVWPTQEHGAAAQTANTPASTRLSKLYWGVVEGLTFLADRLPLNSYSPPYTPSPPCTGWEAKRAGAKPLAYTPLPAVVTFLE